MSLTPMEKLIERLDFSAPRWCIHLPPPCDFDPPVESVARACKLGGKSLAVATLPRPASFRFRLMRRPNIFDWFCAKTNATLFEAERIISDFPVNIHPDFRCNAMNPLRFLGLAAAITEHADVLIYESSGMDPIGTRKIHKYAREQYNRGCLIHLCWQPLTDSCPNVGDCTSVNAIAENAT